jgi:hypothetical protein
VFEKHYCVSVWSPILLKERLMPCTTSQELTPPQPLVCSTFGTRWVRRPQGGTREMLASRNRPPLHRRGGSPRSFAAQQRLAQDDNLNLYSCTLTTCSTSSTEVSPFKSSIDAYFFRSSMPSSSAALWMSSVMAPFATIWRRRAFIFMTS